MIFFKKKMMMMKTNHYQREGIRWKINIINVAAMLIVLAMIAMMG